MFGKIQSVLIFRGVKYHIKLDDWISKISLTAYKLEAPKEDKHINYNNSGQNEMIKLLLSYLFEIINIV